jgi:hypothetical protein
MNKRVLDSNARKPRGKGGSQPCRLYIFAGSGDELHADPTLIRERTRDILLPVQL